MAQIEVKHGQPGWLELVIPVELVQAWIDDPQSNAGLLLTVAEEDQVGAVVPLRSSDAYTSTDRPQLVLELKRAR